MFNELIISNIQMALAIVSIVIIIVGLIKPMVKWPKGCPVKLPPPYLVITMNIFSLLSLLSILRFVGRWGVIDFYFYAIILNIVVIILNAYCLSRLVINAYSFILSCDEGSYSGRKLLKGD
jgi:hypothetical protein